MQQIQITPPTFETKVGKHCPCFPWYLIVSLHPSVSLLFLHSLCTHWNTPSLYFSLSLLPSDWLSSIGASALPGTLSLSHRDSARVQQPSKYTQQGSHSQLDGHHSQHQPVSNTVSLIMGLSIRNQTPSDINPFDFFPCMLTYMRFWC